MQIGLEAAFDASLAAWRKCRPPETTPLDEDIEPVSLSNRNETQIIGVAHDHISTISPILQAAGWQIRQTAEDPVSGTSVVILVRNQADREPECDGGLLFHLIGEFARQAAWSFDPQEAALPKFTDDDHAEAFLYRFGTIGGIRGAGPASIVDLLCMLLWSQVQPPMPKLSDEVLKATPNAVGALVLDVMAGLPVDTAVAMASTVCWLDHRRLSNRRNVKTALHPAHLSRAPMASRRLPPPERSFLETQVTTTLFEALVASRQYAAASRLLAIVGRAALPASGSSGGCAIRFKGPKNTRRGEKTTSAQEMSTLHLIALFPPRSDAEHHELQLLLNNYVDSGELATLLSPQLTQFASVTSCSSWNQLPETEHCVSPIALLLRYSRASSTEDGLSALAALSRCGNPLAVAEGPHAIHSTTLPRWPTTAVRTQQPRVRDAHPVFPSCAQSRSMGTSRPSVGSTWSRPATSLDELDFRGKSGVTTSTCSDLVGEAVVGGYLPLPLSSAARTRMAAFVGYPSQFAAAAIVQGPVADADINAVGSVVGSTQEGGKTPKPSEDDPWVEAAEYCECMPGRLHRGSLIDQLIQLAAHHTCRTVLDPQQWRIEVDAKSLYKKQQRVAEALTDDTDETETDVDTDPDHEDERPSRNKVQIRYINRQDGSIRHVHPAHGMFVEMVRHRRFPREWIEQCSEFSEISSPQDNFNDSGNSLWNNTVFSKRQIVPAVDIHTGRPALQRGYAFTRTVSTGAPREEVHTPRTLTDVATLIVQAIKLREWISIGFGLVPLAPRVLNQDIADVILSFVAEAKNADELGLMMRVWGAMADGTKIRVIDTTHPAMDLYTDDGERAPRYLALPAELPPPLSDEELEELAQPYIKKGAKPLATKPPVSRIGIKENLSGRRAIGAAKPQPWLLSGRAHDEDELGSSDVEDPF